MNNTSDLHLKLKEHLCIQISQKRELLSFYEPCGHSNCPSYDIQILIFSFQKSDCSTIDVVKQTERLTYSTCGHLNL